MARVTDWRIETVDFGAVASFLRNLVRFKLYINVASVGKVVYSYKVSSILEATLSQLCFRAVSYTHLTLPTILLV